MPVFSEPFQYGKYLSRVKACKLWHFFYKFQVGQKCLITTDPIGPGVKFCTAEITAVRKSPDFEKQNLFGPQKLYCASAPIYVQYNRGIAE